MTGAQILIYGLPHIGKTTLIQRIVKLNQSPVKGFHTESVFENQTKKGLVLISHNMKKLFIDYALHGPGRHKAAYHLPRVEFEAFFEEIYNALQPGDLFYIDEIGPLFCRNDAFTERMSKIFNTNNVIGAIALRGHHFIEQLRRRKEIFFYEITAGNRDALLPEISRRIQGEM